MLSVEGTVVVVLIFAAGALLVAPEETRLRVAIMLELSERNTSTSLSVAEIAVAKVNESPSLLPNHKIELIVRNVQV